MYKQVVYNTYIGKCHMPIVKEAKFIEPTVKIGEIAYPCVILDKAKDSVAWPDYYLMGFFEKGSESDPAQYFQCLKPWNKTLHHMYITGIPKGASSLEPFKLNGCLWESYYEDDLHGYLFQVLPSNLTLNFKQEWNFQQ